MTPSEPNDTRAAAEGEQPQSAKFWLSEIDAAKKRERNWVKRADKVVNRFRDERELDDRTERRTNILWSNTETLKSVLFRGIGKPDVRRRFPKKGQDERAARQASMVLENSLSYCADDYDGDTEIEAAVEDWLLPGRGQCWVVYDVEFDQEGGEEVIADQSVRLEYLYWKDFLTSAGRIERDIWWKGRRHAYSRDELKRYFPDHADKVPLNSEVIERPRNDKTEETDDTFKRADVWEIWDKSKRQRVYIAEGYDLILKSDADPYKLRNFYPCPEAIYGVKTTSSLVPVPEYTLYQDQAEELDQITTRLHRLIDALKRRGVYDASLEGEDNQLSNLAHADDNTFVPFKGFAAMMEKGGLKNVFQTEDLAPIIATVQSLYQQRQLLIQTIYEVTGISDVIRGASDPKETATAQKLKGQFGSLRIQRREGRLQRFIRDIFRIKAEIIAEHFTREKLVEMTGIDLPLETEVEGAKKQLAQIQQQIQMAQEAGAPPTINQDMIEQMERAASAVPWEHVSAILRSDKRRGYKIDIETEDTAGVDANEEKQSRIEFIQSMVMFLKEIIPAAEAKPELVPLSKDLVSFGLRAFKVGRALEESFDDAFEKMEQSAKRQPQTPPVDPEAQAKAEKIKSDIQIDQENHQANMAKTKQDLDQNQRSFYVNMIGEALENLIKKQQLEAGEINAAASVEDAGMRREMHDATITQRTNEHIQRIAQGYQQ